MVWIIQNFRNVNLFKIEDGGIFACQKMKTRK